MEKCEPEKLCGQRCYLIIKKDEYMMSTEMPLARDIYLRLSARGVAVLQVGERVRGQNGSLSDTSLWPEEDEQKEEVGGTRRGKGNIYRNTWRNENIAIEVKWPESFKKKKSNWKFINEVKILALKTPERHDRKQPLKTIRFPNFKIAIMLRKIW